MQIPAGYARDLAAGRGASVQLIIDGSNSNTGTVAQGYATRIIHQVAMEHAAARGAGLAGGIELRARAWYNPELVSRAYNVPAVMGIVLLLMSLLLTALSVVREREIGTLEQLLVSPIGAGELILGKMLPVTMIAFIDLAIVVGVGMLWFGIPLEGSPLLLLCGASLYILAGLGMGLLLSTISRTQQEAFMTMFLLLFPMIVLAGLMYPIHTMPAFFQDLTLLNPARHFLELVRAVFLKGAGATDLWLELLALALTAATMLGLAKWRFRQQMR